MRINSIYLWLITLSALSLQTSTLLASSGDETPPNVVIIYADDMGYGDLGANNPESKIPTPRLDQLAAQGIRFTDAHSSSAICTPSRFALLTGQYHWRRLYHYARPYEGTVFEPDDYTLAKMFTSSGYNTAAIGKWHLGWDWQALKKDPNADITELNANGFDWTRPIPDGPLAQGFQYYFGDGTINFPPYCWIENDRIIDAPTAMLDTSKFHPQVPEGTWGTRPGPISEEWDPYEVLPKLTKNAVTWINQQSEDTPFFLYFSLPSPHEPIVPNKEYLGTTEAGPYGDFVYETDAMIGKILDALDDNDLAEDTIVVFTSDNGAELFAYERLHNYGHWSSEPFRGLKRDLWEGGHRVPFIIRWPRRITPGQVSEETISQVDLAATFANLIGYKIDPSDAIDSHDLVPLLEGKDHASPIRTTTIQNTMPGKFAIRVGDWLYINHSTGDVTESPDWFNEQRGYSPAKTEGLLYNLEQDPAQKTNLYEQYPSKVKEMQELLDHYLSGKPSAPRSL